MKYRFLTLLIVITSIFGGCGLPPQSNQRTSPTTTTPSTAMITTSTPEDAFEELLNAGDAPSSESEKIPYEKLISIAEFNFEIIGTKPLQKIQQIVLAEPGWTADSVQDAYIAELDSKSTSSGSEPEFIYRGPVKLSPGLLQSYARSTKSPKIVMDSLRLTKANGYSTPTHSQKTIRDWLANAHNYTNQPTSQPIDLTKLDKVVGATVGVPNSDGIWGVALYAQKDWQTNPSSTFYLQTSMDDLGDSEGTTTYTTYGPFTDNVISLANQAHFLQRGENLSAHIRLYSDVFSASSL